MYLQNQIMFDCTEVDSRLHRWSCRVLYDDHVRCLCVHNRDSYTLRACHNVSGSHLIKQPAVLQKVSYVNFASEMKNQTYY